MTTIDWRLIPLIAAAAATAACTDLTAPSRPSASIATPRAVGGQLSCEVTIAPASATTTSGPDPRTASMICRPARDEAARSPGTDRVDNAADTILERFEDVGFTYGTPTWSLVLGAGTVTVPIALTNHISQPLGTADGVTAATNGTRVFVISGPTVITTAGLLPSVTVTNSTGTGTFTTTNQKYFEYSGIIEPGATSGAVSWDFFITDASKFNFVVGVDAIVP